MSSERLRVHKTARQRLKDLCDDGETYTDILTRVLPTEVTEETKLNFNEDEMVVISVTPEIHTLANKLAGNGVPVRQVIDYYLLQYEMDTFLRDAGTEDPEELIRELLESEEANNE